MHSSITYAFAEQIKPRVNTGDQTGGERSENQILEVKSNPETE